MGQAVVEYDQLDAIIKQIDLLQKWSDISLSLIESYESFSTCAPIEKYDKFYDYANLPKKVLLNIFKYLNEIEISRHVLRVCRSWRNVGQEPCLWKRLTFFKTLPIIDINRLLRMSPELNTLKLVNVSDVKSVIRQFCRCNKKIQHLVIRHCSEEDLIPEPTLLNILACCNKLKTIDLKGIRIPSRKFYKELVCCPSLLGVNFGQNPFISGQDVLTIGLNCHNLEELKITHSSCKKNVAIENDDAVLLFSSLVKTLKRLKFDCLNLQPVAYNKILSCFNLEYLCLLNAHAFPSLLFRNIWKELPKLTKLKLLKATQLNSEDFYHLFTQGKEVLKNVTVLDFSGCWKLNDIGLEAIVQCCGKSLQKFSIACCKNITKIDQIKMNCPNLVQLNIAFCTKLHKLSLENVLEKIPMLETLVIDEEMENISCISELVFSGNVIVYVCLSEYNNQRKLLKA